jgi:hypothetical protein
MFIELLRRTGAAHGRHPARSSHTHDQTQPVLSRVRQNAQKATFAALAKVARAELVRCSGICTRRFWQPTLILQIPSPRVRKSCHSPFEGAEARLRLAHERIQQRANEGQSLPRSMGHARARARRTDQSKRTHTRASFLAPSRKIGSVEGTREPPWLVPGEHSGSTEVSLAHKIIREQILSCIAQDDFPCLQHVTTISKAEGHRCILLY